MSTFIYQVKTSKPGGHMNRQQAIDAGLGYVFDTTSGYQSGYLSHGIEGNNVFIASNGGQMKYKPDEQTWRPVDGLDGVYVGMWNNNRPTPDELARPELIAGDSVTIEDFGSVIIPKARRFEMSEDEIYPVISLPQCKKLIDGEWVRQGVKQRFKRLFDLANEYFEKLVEAMDKGTTDANNNLSYYPPSADDAAIEALLMNYRMGPSEIDLLEIWDDELPLKIVDHVLDSPRYEELIKKKRTTLERQQVGSTSSNGRTKSTMDSDQATPQPSPT